MINDHSVDLDLLGLLCAVHRHRSATRAAAELGVTQSAVSHGLRRLRERLDDPLFVRRGGEMRPTPRAEQLARSVEPHLHAIADIVAEPAPFDPARSERVFRVASLDLLDTLLLPLVLERTFGEAPGVRVEVSAHDGSTLERFDRGTLDAAVHPVLAGAGEALRPSGGFRQRTLLWDDFSLFTPVARPAPRDLADLCRHPHVLVGPGHGPGVVDRALAERGLARRVAVRKTSFSGALRLVGEVGLVMFAPSSLGTIAPPSVRVSASPLPLPRVQVTLAWPERLHADAGHRWFRDQLARAAVDLQAHGRASGEA